MNVFRALGPLALPGVALLAACGSDGPTDLRTPVTVRGFVRDRGGEPIAGAAVMVTGQPSVVSGSDGSYTIPGVVAPYDLTVINGKTALVYKALRRSDPTLVFLDYLGAANVATISGVTPPTSGRATLVFFHSGRNVHGAGFADDTTGRYGITVTWRGPRATQSGQLSVLQLTPGSVSPISYDGYATRPLTITAGSEFSGNDFTVKDLTDPAEQAISGTVAVPAGYTQNRRRFYVFLDSIPVVGTEQGALASAFAYTVPGVATAAFGVAAWAVDPASRSSFFFRRLASASAAGVSVPLAAAPQLARPVDAATSVDTSTRFGWSQGSEAGVNLVELVPDDTTSALTYVVFTTDSDATIPNLTVAGMALPAGARYAWLVDRVFPFASVDEFTGPGLLPLIDLEVRDLGETQSETRTFATRTATGAASLRELLGAAPQKIRRWTWMTRMNGASNRVTVTQEVQ